MNIFNYLRENGIKKVFQTVWKYKIDLIIKKTMVHFLKNKPLRNIIIIESHNDFDCNGGAFYDYLITNSFNEKYKIIWTIKNEKNIPLQLPKNVICVPLFSPSLKKDYYCCVAKYFLSDCEIAQKTRDDQISVYCTHGGCTFKNVKGLLVVPESVDYIICSSPNYAPLMCKNYSIPYPNNKMVYIGFPSEDILFDSSRNDIKKLTSHEYKKIILWMPTFRKMIGGRDDSKTSDLFGIPLIKDRKEIYQINKMLSEKNSLLIIKYHPMQDLSNVNIPSDLSNVIFLTGDMMKTYNIDIYALMRNADGLISDYSSSAYTYLLLDRPIGFVISDLDEYKRGFSIDNYEDMLVGNHIIDMGDFSAFLSDVINENDTYRNERINLLHWLYKYNDGNSCERLATFLKL